MAFYQYKYREVAALAATYACEDTDESEQGMCLLVKQALTNEGWDEASELRVTRLARLAYKLGEKQGWIYPIIAC